MDFPRYVRSLHFLFCSLNQLIYLFSATTSNPNYVAAYKAASSVARLPVGIGSTSKSQGPSLPNVEIEAGGLQTVRLHEVNNDDSNGSADVKNEENISQSVAMNDEEREIFREFRKTMTDVTVKVITMKRIKRTLSRREVYEAILKTKTKELKNKNVKQIEQMLFHGTASKNVAKIVNGGFNRDFNRMHRYGKGTYFSSMASESARYCDLLQPIKKILVCKVIVGEYCIGTPDMDGSSVPYKSDQKTRYESCVNRMENPTIFVINRDYHAIPTHIITYKYKQ